MSSKERRVRQREESFVSPVIARHRSLIGMVLFAAAATACKGDVRVVSAGSDVKGVKFVARDTSRVLGPGDIRVPSKDSSVEIALIGDSVVAGFGQRVRDKIKRETDTSAVKGNGFGAGIEKFVKGTVATALDHDMEFPVSQISDVRYEDGMLRFYDNNGKPMHLFERDKHDSDSDAVFSESDAQAFIAAFKAKKQKV